MGLPGSSHGLLQLQHEGPGPPGSSPSHTPTHPWGQDARVSLSVVRPLPCSPQYRVPPARASAAGGELALGREPKNHPEAGVCYSRRRQTTGVHGRPRGGPRAGPRLAPVRDPPDEQETCVQSLVWEDPLKKQMAIHSSILAWEIPWTEDPGGLQSMGLQKSRTQLSN